MKTKFFIPFFLVIIFTILFSYHSILRHINFNSHAFDLGIYTQAIYLYSQGELAFSTLKHMILLADHFGLILAILSPIYKLFPSPITLLILQAIFVSLSGIPIYFISQDKLKNIWISLLITISYFTSVGIISAIDFDFHLATISTLPLSLILYFWYFKKWSLYWVTLFLSLTFKEDIPIFIFGFGIFQLLQKQFRLGLLTIIFSILSLFLIKFYLMSFLWQGGGNAYISTSIIPFDSPIDLLSILLVRPTFYLDIIFTSPAKLQTLDSLLRPFAFLSVLSPIFYLTAFLHLYLRFSSTYS